MGYYRDTPKRLAAPDFLQLLVLLDEELWVLASWSNLRCAPLNMETIQGYASTYITLYFTVRSRALASFLSAITGTLACVLFGFFLDAKGLTIKVRVLKRNTK